MMFTTNSTVQTSSIITRILALELKSRFSNIDVESKICMRLNRRIQRVSVDQRRRGGECAEGVPWAWVEVRSSRLSRFNGGHLQAIRTEFTSPSIGYR
jgi:hypothetical protein